MEIMMKPVEAMVSPSVTELSSRAVTPAAESAQIPEAAITPEQVERSVERINQFFDKTDYGLQFSVDNDTGKQMVKVTDRESGDVIRQLPSESMLRLSRAVGDLQGMLLKEVV